MKPIPGYEGIYACTKDGRIWSYPKHRGKGLGYEAKGLWLVGDMDKNGYMSYRLYRNKVSKKYLGHRIIATTYLPNKNNYPVVRHLDNNKLNNSVSNLEWCTYLVNNNQIHSDGLYKLSEKGREQHRKSGKRLAELGCGYTARSKKVMQLTKEGILCKIYESGRKAAVANKLDNSWLSKCARANSPYGGYYWKIIN